MIHVIRRSELKPRPNRTIRFEGEPYQSRVSFFLVDAVPGQGPGLHVHPYPETWIVRGGRAEMTAGGEKVEVGAGDIIVVGPDTPHKFRSLGPERLDIVCIHPSDRIIQEDLPDDEIGAPPAGR